MTLPVQRAVRLGFGAALLALVGADAVTLALTDALVRARAEAVETHATARHIEHLFALVQDAEAGQRGFLLTADARDLVPYEAAVRRLGPALDEVAEGVAADSAQARRAAQLRAALAERLDEMEASVAQARADGPDAALRRAAVAGGARTTAEIRALGDTMRAHQYHALSGQVAGIDGLAHRARTAIPLSGLLALLLLGAGYLFARRSLTERDRAAEAIRRSEARFHVFMENTPVAAFIKDEEGRYWFMNRAMERAHGTTADEALGRTDAEWLPAEFAARASASDRHVLERGERWEGFRTETRPDGTPREWFIQKFPLDEGERRMVGGIAIDMTEQRAAERRLRESHLLLEAVVEGSPDAIFVKDAAGRYVMINSAGAATLGRVPAEVVGRTDEALLPAAAAARFRETDTRVLERGEPVVSEEVVEMGGAGRAFLARKAPLWNAEGEVIGVVGISHEITERKRIEQALQESEERFRTLAAATREGILVHERGVILDANESAARLFGTRVEALLGRTVLELAAPGSQPAVLESMLTGTDQTFEVIAQRPDGSTFPAELHGRAIQWQGRAARVVSLADIGARKDAEAALARSEAYFRSLIENSQDVITLLDVDGFVRYVSPSVQRVLGFTAEEFAGQHAFALVHPGDLALLQRVFDDHAAAADPDAVVTARFRLRARDGTWRVLESKATNRLRDPAVRAIVVNSRDVTERDLVDRMLRESNEELTAVVQASPLAIVAMDRSGQVTLWNAAAERTFGWQECEVLGAPLPYVPADARAQHEALRARVLRGEGFAGTEVVRRRRDGSEIRLSVFTAPLYDAAGEVRGIMSINQDITERVRTQEQLEAYSRELERSNRELQDFAYVASHDLQEPLRKIRAFGDRLAGRYGDALDETGRDYITRMQNAAARMHTLIHDLLAFSRVASHAREPEAVALDAVAAGIVGDLQGRIESTGGVVELAALPPVLADPMQMRQLLQNLVGNALKFHRPGVPPRVRVSAETDGARRVTLHVRDNGIGFDIRYLDRIFSPFQRLHGRGEFEGTGMGLAICRRIAERHGGEITATSVPGEGSCFSVTLPLARDPSPEAAAA